MTNTISLLAAGTFHIWAVLIPVIVVVAVAAVGLGIFFLIRWKKKQEAKKQQERLEAQKRQAIRESITSQIQMQKAADLRRERVAKAAPKTVIDAPREFGRKSVFGSGARKPGDSDDSEQK